MDMESRRYKDHLVQLVKEVKLPVVLIDGPFKFSNPQRSKDNFDKKSIVVLKIVSSLAIEEASLSNSFYWSICKSSQK